LYYHFNFTASTKGVVESFFAEVKCTQKGEREEMAVSCFCIVNRNDNGITLESLFYLLTSFMPAAASQIFFYGAHVNIMHPSPFTSSHRLHLFFSVVAL
jgi:hypothetical protein